MSAGAMQSDGVTFIGDLYRTTGPAFNANPFTPIGAANVTKVGTMTVSFVDVNAGTLRYTVDGVEVTKVIERQVFGSRAAACFPTTDSRATATNYQDLWWNPAESGWGINVTHQDATLFATLFSYDATGKALWLVMSAGQRQADGSYAGDLFRTSGPAFNASPFTGSPRRRGGHHAPGLQRRQQRHAYLHLQRRHRHQGDHPPVLLQPRADLQLGGTLCLREAPHPRGGLFSS